MESQATCERNVQVPLSSRDFKETRNQAFAIFVQGEGNELMWEITSGIDLQVFQVT